MNEFAKRLKEARKARKLTQEELAEKADISRVMVSRYETEMVIPTAEVLISLADALGVSIDYLLGRISEQNGFFQLSSDMKSNSADSSNDLPQSKEDLREFILRILHEQNLLD